jgi:2-methylcitrate dehydratase PrpD
LDITRRIGEYVAETGLDAFPQEAVEAAKGAIIDCLACALAGSGEPLAQVLTEFVNGNGGGRPVSTVIGLGFQTSAPDAALINGAIAHALDYDDITRSMKGHPTAVLLPGALALAEEQGSPGHDVLLAYMLGFEVACSVGEAMSVAYADDLGWHPTGPLGALAAAAAASHILKLDPRQTAMAISLAASQAAGLRGNFGTMTKPFHAGAACRTGVTSAKLIQSGFTAAEDVLENRFGFIHAFSGGKGYDAEMVIRNLGEKCYLMESGVEIKKYPCCGSAHLALDAISDLMADQPSGQKIDAAQVERVGVLVDFDPPRSLIHYKPTNALEGKFSMQYCLAAAVLDGKVGLDTFTDAQVQRPEAQDLISRVNMRRIPGNDGKPSWVEAYNEVEVRLKDGRVLSRRASRVDTGALRGVTMSEIEQKFRDCAAPALSSAATEESLDLLGRLEDIPDLNRIVHLLKGGGANGII